jgi:hypothetical protein
LNIDGPITLWPILLDLLFNSKYLLAYLNPSSSINIADEEDDIIQKSADCIEELVSGSRGGASIGAGFVTKARAEVLLDWFSGDLLGSIIEQSVACRSIVISINSPGMPLTYHVVLSSRRCSRCDLIHLQTFYFPMRALHRRPRSNPLITSKLENSEAFVAT